MWSQCEVSQGLSVIAQRCFWTRHLCFISLYLTVMQLFSSVENTYCSPQTQTASETHIYTAFKDSRVHVNNTNAYNQKIFTHKVGVGPLHCPFTCNLNFSFVKFTAITEHFYCKYLQICPARMVRYREHARKVVPGAVCVHDLHSCWASEDEEYECWKNVMMMMKV